MKSGVIKIGLILGLCFCMAITGSWLYQQSKIIDGEKHYNITETIEQLKAVDARWNEDVLKSRLSLTQDYDLLVNSIQSNINLEKELSSHIDTIIDESDQVNVYLGEYREKTSSKIDFVEQFKGENSILRNSFLFIPFSIQKLSDMITAYKAEINSPVNTLYNLESHIQGLLIEFLDFTAKVKSARSTDLKQRVQILQLFLQKEELPENIQAYLTIILNHVNTVLRKKPVVDDLLTTIVSLPTGASLDQVRTAYNQYYDHRVSEGRMYQTLFTAYLAALAIFATYVGLRLWNKRRIRMLTTMNEALEKKVELSKELEKAYDDLAQSKMHLVQSEKMSALGQMVAGVAHEINTPLAYSRSNVALVNEQLDTLASLVDAAADQAKLLNESDRDDIVWNDQLSTVASIAQSLHEEDVMIEMAELLKASVSGLDRIAEMVLSLKDFSRLDRKKVDQVNLNEGLDSALMIAQNTLKHKAEVVKKYGDIPPVKCAPSQINQVFLNMLVNAAQAIEEWGTITLTTVAKRNHVEVTIEDDGQGIPEDVLPNIFNPFYTTKDVGEGTGLGLAISYQIIEQHGGEISVESTIGQGTRFTISLPLVSDVEVKMLKSGVIESIDEYHLEEQ